MMTLKEYLAEQDLSLKEFASFSGISVLCLWRLSNGKKTNKKHIAKIIEGLTKKKVPFDALYKKKEL
jgi:predicted transcriptional regulator